MIGIKDWDKMPESCYECHVPIYDDNYETEFCSITPNTDKYKLDTAGYYKTRHPDCPLVEIPDPQDIRDAQRLALD